jgi:zinc ribbon protein
MTTDPGLAHQDRRRSVLRVLGVLCMGIAVVLIALAIADFVHAFNAEDFDTEPTKFWYFFVALPFFAIGGFCLQAGFLGVAARYTAGETMPVMKDSAAYLTDGQGIRGIGRTVDDETAAAGPYCARCGVRNDAGARFCDACGTAIG